MKVRIFETDVTTHEMPTREFGILELQGKQIVPQPTTPRDLPTVQYILENPITVLIEGHYRDLTAETNPEAFLQWLHRAYHGSALWAGRAEE